MPSNSTQNSKKSTVNYYQTEDGDGTKTADGDRLKEKAMQNRINRDRIKPNSSGYIAIYIERSDGDGELYAVLALENDQDFEECVNVTPSDVLINLEARLIDNGFETHRIYSSECNFPQVYEFEDFDEIVVSKHAF